MPANCAALTHTAASTATTAWEAELTLGFSQRGDKTALVKRQHRGPLTVQRPFYPEAKSATYTCCIHPVA